MADGAIDMKFLETCTPKRSPQAAGVETDLITMVQIDAFSGVVGALPDLGIAR